MLKDCLEIFNEQLEQTKQLCGDGDHLILDTYVPADGDYLIVHKDGKVEKCTVTMDKKTELYRQTGMRHRMRIIS